MCWSPHRIPQARQVLRKLIAGRLAFHAVEEDGRRGFRFDGEDTYGGLFSGPPGTGVPDGTKWPL